VIRFESVSFAYGRNPAVEVLKDVSFALEPGEMGVVRGGTGSGKTTLMRLAAGLLTPKTGKVTAAGRRLNLLRGKERTGLRGVAIAYLPQQPGLVPYMTALENVLLAAMATKTSAPEARAMQLLTELGAGHRAGHLPAALSAGERQCCAVARALLARPRLILADEPTASLDPECGQAVLRLLSEAAQGGAAVLIAARAELATLRIDRAYALRDGRLREA
jgi:ABC-type lipoprotein export system ATPase subunit